MKSWGKLDKSPLKYFFPCPWVVLWQDLQSCDDVPQGFAKLALSSFAAAALEMLSNFSDSQASGRPGAILVKASIHSSTEAEHALGGLA